MFPLPRSVQLLKKVALRLHLAAIGQRLYLTFLAGCAIYALFLLASRLTGYYTEWVTLRTMLIVPSLAAVVALLWHRRPTLVDAARAIDRQHGTKDLFLTVALLEKSAGEYQALVAKAAEDKAAKVLANAVVPFRSAERLMRAALAVVLVAAGFLWVPGFDPFGKVEAARLDRDRKKQLEESKQLTEKRIDQLKKDDSDGPVSDETKKAIENLKTALNKMKPNEKSDNLKELVGQQKHLGDSWRKLNNEKLKELLSHNAQGQEFGAISKDKLEKWTKELQEGSTKSLQKELDEIRKDLEQLAKTDDPVKKAELEQKIRKRMKELNDFATDKVNSKPLAAALQRAMKQLEAARMEGMDKESIEAAERSLDLSKLELKEIAQSAKDLKALEDALKVVQMAKQLNDAEKLDGEMSGDAQTTEEYAEFYAQLIAQLGGGEEGEGDGDATGGEGMGGGGVVPEDDSVETGFKTEQSKSAVTAGKVLLSVKTKGMSDKGDAKKEYKNLIQKVKQGYSEAILQEQIPPGYHDGIKSYFDNLDKSTKSGKSDDAGGE
ncbi:MAG: hypothetical protein ACM3U2_17390 [Deltaproteobacteria bacterium]